MGGGGGVRKISIIIFIINGSVLGPVLILIYINDLPDGITSLCKVFADNASLFQKFKI